MELNTFMKHGIRPFHQCCQMDREAFGSQPIYYLCYVCALGGRSRKVSIGCVE